MESLRQFYLLWAVWLSGLLAKIGVYGAAICAKSHNIPVYCFAPTSTLDFELKSGDEIHIEERSSKEALNINGVYIAPADTPVLNYAFDVTPAKYWDAIITEKGLLIRRIPSLCKNLRINENAGG